MNPQQNSTPAQDKEPAIQVPEVPAAPTPNASVTPTSPALPQAPTSLPDTVAAPEPTVPAPMVAPTAATPATAGDVDIIEKEWVDKADAVVKQTTGDPHAEEEEVEGLQMDYLKKRYDHTVDKPQEG